MLRNVILFTIMLIETPVILNSDFVKDQLFLFKEQHPQPVGLMTTSAGAPVELKDATSTLNSNLLNNDYFMDTMSHLVGERIPERVVHAKAAGAFGYFEVTYNISKICKAALFTEDRKRTPVAVRFSPVVVERGGSDTARDAHGFAVKFYTERGNFDIVGLNTPVFAVKDPAYFPAFVRAQKRNPTTNLNDRNMLWDFITLRPESMLMFLMTFSDRGIPNGYRHMPGFSIHTYEVINKNGEQHFIRFHFIPDAGIENIKAKKAAELSFKDADYSIRDLYNAIARGEFPSWTVAIQVLSLNDVNNAAFDIFDVTKLLSLKDYPLQILGRIVLDHNPVNYFAEIEQLALNPSNLVPGILGAPDKMFEARRLVYRDAQSRRLGVNFNQIPINCPLRNRVFTYNRDGMAPVGHNSKDAPNYFPNSFNGPLPYYEQNKIELLQIFESDASNYEEASEYFMNELTKEEKNIVVKNIVHSLSGVAKMLQQKAIRLLTNIHPELGNQVAEVLKVNKTSYYG